MVDSILEPLLMKYLGEFFLNFDIDGLDMSSIKVKNLILNQKLLSKISIPIRLRFGMIRKLSIEIKKSGGWFEFDKYAANITISDIFLCFEMLNLTKWDEKLVLEKYQNCKKSALNDLNDLCKNQLAQILQKEFTQLKTGESYFSKEVLMKIANNSEIKIQNVHILYEDKLFNFNIGLLLPLVEVVGKKEDNSDGGLSKTLNITDVSMFVNLSKDTIDKILTEAQIETKQSKDKQNKNINNLKQFLTFDNQEYWNRYEDWETLCKKVKSYMEQTFQDSTHRYEQTKDKQKQINNMYIFQKRFAIKFDLLKLNKPKQNSPSLKLDLDFGSRDNADVHLNISLEERQLYCLLHMTTFFNAFNNYSQGVVKTKFLSKNSSRLYKIEYEQYLKDYEFLIENFLSKTIKNVVESEQLKFQDKLWKTEEHYRTDLILKLRRAKLSSYVTKKKIFEEYDLEQVNARGSFWSRTDAKKVQEGLDKALKNYQQKQDDEKTRYQTELDKIEQLIQDQFEKDEIIFEQEVDEDIEAEQKAVNSESSWTKINFTMPQLALIVTPIAKNIKKPLCEINIKGTVISLDIKTLPDCIDFNFSIDSLDVKDLNVKQQVTDQNGALCGDRKFSSKVIETMLKGDETCVKQSDMKLIKLNVNISEDQNRNKDIKNSSHTSINLDIQQTLLIFSNFYFIKSLLQLVQRVFKDMNAKRYDLINPKGDNENQVIGDVRRHIIDGFKVVAKLQQFTQDASAQLNRENLKQSQAALSFSLNMKSPKLIIDEYLLAEKVVNPKKPCYFLIDMGNWTMNNSVGSQTVEVEPDQSVYDQKQKERQLIESKEMKFESFDMSIKDIRITYNFHDYTKLLDEKAKCNFILCDKFTLGFQFQIAVDNIDDSLTLPLSQINLKFEQLKLNLERSVFRQLLKVKTFVTEGSFLNEIKEVIEALSQDLTSEIDSSQIEKQQIEPSLIKDSDYLSENSEIPQTQSSPSSMRVNLLFKGVLVRGQEAEWDQVNHNLKDDTKNILQIQAQQLKLTVHMSDIKSRLSVLVLLTELSIDDLKNEKYIFKQLVKVAPQNIISHIKKQGTQQFFNQKKKHSVVCRQFSKLLNLDESAKQNVKNQFNFDEFKAFTPRMEFIQNKHQVSVHFGKQTEEVDNQPRKTQIAESSTIIKLQDVELVVHFELICAMLSFVFNVLEDLKDVEDKYKDHISKQKQQTSTELLNQQKSQREDKIKQKEYFIKNVIDYSTLVFEIPKITLIIPTNLEKKSSLSLQLSSDVRMQMQSKSQLTVEYEKIKNEATHEITEVENNDPSGRVEYDYDKSFEVKLTQLQLIIISEEGKTGTISDNIVSPVDFEFESTTNSYSGRNPLTNLIGDCTEKQKIDFKKVQEIFTKQKDFDRITSDIQQIKTKNAFNFKFRTKQLNQYLQIIQLVIYQQSLISTDPKPFNQDFPEHPAVQDQPKLIDQLSSTKVQVQEHEIYTLEELLQYSKQSNPIQKETKSRQKKAEKKFEIVHSQMKIDTQGMKICLLDDVTSKYEEPLLQISFINLDLEKQSLNTKVFPQNNMDTEGKLDVFQQQELHKIIQSYMKDIKNIQEDISFARTKIDITMEASYFNHKSFGEEMLIEKYVIEIIMDQQEPTKPNVVSVESKHVFNLNLTYGCILSVYQVLHFIQESKLMDTQMQNFQQEQKQEQNSLVQTPENSIILENLIIKKQSLQKEQTVEEISQEQAKVKLEEEKNLEWLNQKPRFKFYNFTNKNLDFWIKNESQQDQSNNKNLNQDKLLNKFILSPNNEFTPQSEHDKVDKHVIDLLKSYEIKNLKNAQLYLDFIIDGYQEKQNISLNQIGIFCHDLIPNPTNKNTTTCCSQAYLPRKEYCVMRLVRNKGETEIYFESNAVLFNRHSHDIMLIAFDPQTSQIVEPELKIEQKQVAVLPLTWFEKNVQVQVELDLIENDKQKTKFTPNQSKYIFRHGTICQVLNPKITHPIQINSAEMHLEDQWLALEFVLLTTRSKYNQFLIMIHTLTEIQNSMFNSMNIVMSYLKEKQPNEKEKNFQIQQSIQIPQLNMKSLGSTDNLQFKLKIKVQEENAESQALKNESTHHFVYQYELKNWQQLQKETQYRKVTKGQVIKLDLVKNPAILRQQSDAVNYLQNLDKAPQYITCVIEQVACQENLISTSYNDFTLREQIYNHSARQRFEIYSPYIAVNETDNEITLLSSDRKQLNVLPPKKTIQLNLMRLLVPKIRIRINRDKFCDSELFDLGTLGVHGRVKLEKIQIKGQKVAKQFIDIGASIHVCDGENYSKTKIIRFTNRFTIINRLGFPIQVRRTLQSDLNVLENNVPLCLDLFFITEFKSKSRNCFEKDTTDNYEDLQLRCYTQGSKDDKTPWSVQFCGENLGDFQIKVPKVAESEQPLLGEYIEREKKRVWYDLDNDYIVRVTIMNDPTFNEKIFIIIQKSLQPDYIFKNHLDKPIQLRQEFQDENTNPIIIEAAGASPIVIHTVINQPEYAAKNKQIILYINKDPNQKLIWNTAENLTSGTYYCQQQIAGNMRMLEIYDNKNEEGVKKAKNNEERKVEMIEQARIYAEENQSETKNDLLSDLVYDIKLAGIGFSLVDFKPQELCYIIFDQIHVSYKIFQTIIRKQTQKLEDLEISIRNFQIDAMQNEICPILLGPKDPFRNIERMFQHLQIEEAKDQDTKEKYKINQIQDKQPILQIQMKRYLEDDGDDITETIEQLEIELQPLEFKLHLSLVMEIQQLMNSLISLFNDLGTINSSELIKMVIETQEMMSDDPSKPKKEIRQDNNQCRKVNYIVQKMKTKINKNIMAKLALSKEFLDQPHPPKCLTVDYSSKPADLNIKKEKLFLENFKIRAVKCFMTLRIRGIESILQKSGPMGWLLNLVSNIADITEAEFNFTELEMQKLAQANTMITENLIQHYKHEAIQQFYQVFGSQDIIGNPSSFITNVSKGTDNFYNGPLGALLDNKPKEAAWGVVSSLAGILSNTGIAITNSYTGVSGSAYLGLRNICGAGLTHEDLDRPLTVGGGLKKGGIGFLQETKNGFEGIYFVPKNTVKTQGKAPLPLLKGIGQGILQFTLFPVNAFFRMSYDISTGTMQHLKGVKDHGQRYRYPRYFDQNERMEPYNHNHAHAQLALKIVNKGQFKKEVLQHVYDVSKYDKDEFKGFFRDRVIIITNKNILYIHNNRTLIEGVQLSEIKGMMFYFAKQEYNSVRMELKADRMVSMETKLPEKNKLIVKDLKDRLDDYQKHVENAETIKKKEVVETKENQNQLNKTLEAHQQDNLQKQQAAPVLFEDENGNQYELTWETLEDQDQQLLVQ